MIGATLFEFHRSWAWIVIVANGLSGLWVLGAHKINLLRGRALWHFVVLAQISVFIQVLAGVGVAKIENLSFPKFHAFYGFVATIVIGIIYSYRDQLKSRIYLLYGFGSLFIMGLSIRAVMVS